MDQGEKLKKFIKYRPHLVWYVKNLDDLSREAIVEAVLNFGDFNDVKELIYILGVEETAKIFKKQARRERCNYRPYIKNYFNLYFNKYAASSS